VATLDVIGAALAIGAALYLAASLYMYGRQRGLLYRPEGRPGPPAEAGLPEMAEVTLTTADGLRLGAWYAPAEEGRLTVVFFHGNSGNRAWAAEKVRPYLDAGHGVLVVDYRGYGGNPGRPSENGLRTDAVAALGFLRGRGLGADDIVYHGESLGSGVATWLASEHPPRGLIVEAAFTSIPHVARGLYPWLPTRLATRDRFTSRRRMPRVRAPVLIIHGERDALVPVAQARALHELHPGPTEIVTFPDGAHADLYDHGAAEVVLDWLDRLPARAEQMARSPAADSP